MLAVFFGLGMGPVMSSFATELFPTEIRGQAAAWIRNWFEIAGYVFGPALVGILGDHATGAIGNIGDTVTLLMILQIPTLYLIWRFMPETKGLELEEHHARAGRGDRAVNNRTFVRARRLRRGDARDRRRHRSC